MRDPARTVGGQDDTTPGLQDDSEMKRVLCADARFLRMLSKSHV